MWIENVPKKKNLNGIIINYLYYSIFDIHLKS
jgi:hypothetical protein